MRLIPKNRKLKSRIHRSRGFTLTEVLISAAITSIVAITVYSSFKTVVSSYEKNSAAVQMVENARAALGDFSVHIKEIPSATVPSVESFTTNPAPFVTSDLDTAAIALAATGYSQDSIHFLGTNDLEYWYFLDTTTNELMRNTGGTVEPLAFSVISSSFMFYSRNTGIQQWDREWNSSTRGIPRSVYIALTIKDKDNRLEPHTYTTLVTLP